MPHFVTSLAALGERLYVGDVMDSVSFLKYHEGTNKLVEFADGAIPRSITAMEVLDYNTVICGDKGGNLFVERVNPRVDEDTANPTGSRGLLNAAPNKVSFFYSFTHSLTFSLLHYLTISLTHPLTHPLTNRPNKWLAFTWEKSSHRFKRHH